MVPPSGRFLHCKVKMLFHHYFHHLKVDNSVF